jgi:hypothetical protein
MGLKPTRTAGDVLRDMAARAKGQLPEAKPLPLPPVDAPLPPRAHNEPPEREPGSDDDQP